MLHLFPDAGDVAVRYRLNVGEDDGAFSFLLAPSVNTA
jgi:hypothetical protein